MPAGFSQIKQYSIKASVFPSANIIYSIESSTGFSFKQLITWLVLSPACVCSLSFKSQKREI